MSDDRNALHEITKDPGAYIERMHEACGCAVVAAVADAAPRNEKSLSEIGMIVGGLIRNLKWHEGERGATPTRSEAVKAAAHAAKKIEEAMEAIGKFDDLWQHPLDPEMGKGGSPWAVTTNGRWSHEVALDEMRKAAEHFRSLPQDEELELFTRAPKRTASIVADILAPAYEDIFGRKAGYTTEPDESVRGPFIDFVRFIADQAGLKIADQTIAAYAPAAEKSGD